MKNARTEVSRHGFGSESGIALPVAIMMIVLVGVMGAGLLTFVTTDLTTVVEVNQGQKAFDMADAGVQAAKREIAERPVPDLYDGGGGDSQWSSSRGGMNLSFSGVTGDSVNVKISYSTVPSIKYTVLSEGTAGNARRKIEAVFRAGTSGGVTAPRNYYSGSGLTFSNLSEIRNGDILVDNLPPGVGNATISNTFNLRDGDVLVKGDGNFPNDKTLTNGDYYVGGRASFDNNTTVNNGNIYVGGGGPNTSTSTTFTIRTTVTGGGIYIGHGATLSNDTTVTGGDVYVKGNAQVGNLQVGSGNNVLVGGNFNVDNGLRVENGNIYVGGNAVIQNATITNSRIFITGTAEFRQTNSITNSTVYAGGNTTFTNSSNLTGTSLFARGNVNFSNPMTIGNSNDTYYGNWQNAFNSVARASVRSGIGATGTITGNLTGVARGTRSYDRTTNPCFAATTTATTCSNTRAPRMVFPFDTANPQGKPLFDAAASRLAAAGTDAIRRIEEGRLGNAYLDGLKQKAISQGNYREVGAGQQELVETVQPYRPEQKLWPANSTYNTVVYYKFPSYSSNNKVQWLIKAGCADKTRKGILVVENGVFSTYGGTLGVTPGTSTSGFNGTIITRNGKFDVTGYYCMNGYVNSTASNEQTAFSSSNSSRFNIDDVPPLSELNDPASAQLQTWRELYQ